MSKYFKTKKELNTKQVNIKNKYPISDKDKKILLDLDHKTITNVDIIDMFGYKVTKDDNGRTIKKPPRFNVQDKMLLAPNEYINEIAVETTVGRFLMNKLFLEGCVDHVIENRYYNHTMNAKQINALFKIIATALLNGKVDIPTQLYDFYRRYEFWSLNLVPIFSPSWTPTMLTPSDELAKYKEELMKKYPNPTIQTMVHIEELLVKKADELSKGDEGKAIFDSGARGSFDNDYKNMFISIGPVKNPITNEFDFMQSNYMDGLEKKDLVAAGNLIVNAEYPKAIGTAVNGYQTKQLNAILQNVGIDKADTDCGTKNGLEVIITKDTLWAYHYQYIMGKNGRLLMIDENLPAEYLNRPLKLRSPMYCRADKICSVCAGKRFYLTDVENVGLLLMNMSSSMLNANLKQRHSMKISTNKVDITKLLI